MVGRSLRARVRSLFFLLFTLCVACAAPPHAASQSLGAWKGPYELQVLVDGVPARSFSHDGETHLLGEPGARYVLRVHNRSGRRVEAVVSVDGLDVIDGKSADFAHKRGYLIEAHSFVDIDGWRLSEREAAAFRFAPIAESYAAKSGKARNVGVIGVALFPERVVRTKPIAPQPESEYAPHSAPAADDRMQESSAGVAPASPAAAPARSAGSASYEGPGSALGRAEKKRDSARHRAGLGTEFGEAVSSQIREVQFVRENATRPSSIIGLRYNDRQGLYALGIDVDGCEDAMDDLALRQSADPFPSTRAYARPPADWRRD